MTYLHKIVDNCCCFVAELASDLFSEIKQGHSLNLLYCEDVATISRNACVSPCSLVLALLYLERLKKCNIDYLRCVDPSKLFLISLVRNSKVIFKNITNT